VTGLLFGQAKFIILSVRTSLGQSCSEWQGSSRTCHSCLTENKSV